MSIRDHVAWTLQATRALGVKVVNAGGVAAFKDNMQGLLVRRRGARIRR